MTHPTAAPAGEHPEGTKILILGILGITICTILAPFAWVVGNRVLREIDQSGGMLAGNRGMVQAGRILGMIGTVLLLLTCFGGLAVGVLSLFAESSSSVSG